MRTLPGSPKHIRSERAAGAVRDGFPLNRLIYENGIGRIDAGTPVP